MAKKESTFLSMSLTLLIVAMAASASLGFIYELTKEPIAKSKQLKTEKAIEVVVPEFNNSPSAEFVMLASDKDSLKCYIAKNGDEIVGYAIETYTDKGFSGRFDIMVGFLPDATIYNTAVLKHLETPGLGDKMDEKKSDFPIQFKEKNSDNFSIKVKKDGGDVDAITAATISSRAFCDAVERADNALRNYLSN